VESLPNAIIAAGSILYYLDTTQHTQISHISQLSRIEEDKYVRLDRFTIRSLELLSTINEGGKSLLNILDRTVCPMGGRMIRRWMIFPLKELKPVNDRLDVVDAFIRDSELRDQIGKHLGLMGDLERIVSK